MSRRPRYIILGAVLGVAAMPVIVALAWGVLLASGWLSAFCPDNNMGSALPVAGFISFLVAVLVILLLVYQGYRLDCREKTHQDQEEL